MHTPKGWQTSEEGYEGHQRHCHGEDDDVVCECHGESRRVVLGRMRHMVRTKSEGQNMARLYFTRRATRLRA
jgi:hypothetical protein